VLFNKEADRTFFAFTPQTCTVQIPTIGTKMNHSRHIFQLLSQDTSLWISSCFFTTNAPTFRFLKTKKQTHKSLVIWKYAQCQAVVIKEAKTQNVS